MWLTFLLLLLCAAPTRVEEAKTLFRKYVDAVKAGNQGEALGYWNQEEIETYGADSVDWQLTILLWKTRSKDIAQFTPEIRSARSTEDYVELVVEWQNTENNVVREDYRYFIEQDGRLACANPVKVHTKGWLEAESKYVVYHARKEDQPEDAVLAEIDRFCEEMSRRLGVSLRRKVHCYKTDSADEVGKMFNLPRTLARVYKPGYTTVCMTHFPHYEIMHIFRGELKRGPTATILHRGLGVYLGGTSFFTPHTCIHWAQQSSKKWHLSLDEIDETCYVKPARDPNNRAACLSGAFVKYLVDQYGMDKFKRMYIEADDWSEFKRLAHEVYGKDISQIEEEWPDWLSELRMETVEPGTDPRARTIFELEDPTYDDNGDGDYVYPEGREEGIFDLAGFRVLADEERVYFELAFSKLADGSLPEGDSTESKPLTCSDWGFKDTFAKIVISTGAESNQTRMGNLWFDAPYNYCIDVSGSGVLVCNSNGIWLDLLRVKSGMPELREGNSLRLSVPTSIIGKPDESWKYTVLVGSHAGRETMGHGVGRFRRVGEKADEEQGGGGLDSDIDPDIYDILLPRAEDQARILSGYDEASSTLVTIPLLARSQIERR